VFLELLTDLAGVGENPHPSFGCEVFDVDPFGDLVDERASGLLHRLIEHYGLIIAVISHELTPAGTGASGT
jgi:hypothetical protein